MGLLATMEQAKLLDVPTVEPLAKTWDSIHNRPYDSQHQRALEGLPHYWRLSWGFADAIQADCGRHMLLTRVDWLEDPQMDAKELKRCPYRAMGMCE